MDIKDINFAIDILSHPQSGDASDIKEAFKVAIESLKAWKELLGQEPCEDAINREWLKTAIHNFYYGLKHTPTEEDIQAYIDAAPSVTPQPCGDAISREQAKSAIRDRFKDLPSRVEINTILNELPSVTSQPKTGHWISCGNVYCGDVYMCSECDYVGVDYDNYCSNCGARMEKGE